MRTEHLVLFVLYYHVCFLVCLLLYGEWGQGDLKVIGLSSLFIREPSWMSWVCLVTALKDGNLETSLPVLTQLVKVGSKIQAVNLGKSLDFSENKLSDQWNGCIGFRAGKSVSCELNGASPVFNHLNPNAFRWNLIFLICHNPHRSLLYYPVSAACFNLPARSVSV